MAKDSLVFHPLFGERIHQMITQSLFVIFPAIVLHVTTGEIYYGTIGEGPASYLIIESRR